MQKQNYELDFTGQDIYAGIDAHLKSWKITIMVQGIPCKTFSQNPDADILRKHLSKNYPNGNYHSAYEAGFCGFSPHLLTRVKSDTTSRVFLIPSVFWMRFPFFVNSPLLLGGRLPKKEKNEVFGWCRFSPLGGIIPIPCYKKKIPVVH